MKIKCTACGESHASAQEVAACFQAHPEAALGTMSDSRPRRSKSESVPLRFSSPKSCAYHNGTHVDVAKMRTCASKHNNRTLWQQKNDAAKEEAA